MKTSLYLKQLVSKYEQNSIAELISLYNSAVQKIASYKNGEITAQQLTSAKVQYYIVSDIIEKKRKTVEFKEYIKTQNI